MDDIYCVEIGYGVKHFFTYDKTYENLDIYDPDNYWVEEIYVSVHPYFNKLSALDCFNKYKSQLPYRGFIYLKRYDDENDVEIIKVKKGKYLSLKKTKSGDYEEI